MKTKNQELGYIDGFNGTPRNPPEGSFRNALAYNIGYRDGKRDADKEQAWSERQCAE